MPYLMITLVACALARAAGPTLQLIPQTNDPADGISADGSKVLIDTQTGIGIWSPGGALQPITGLPGYMFTHGAAISGDGATVVGRNHGFGQGDRAFRWTAGGGPQPLIDPLDPTQSTYGNAVNTDGSVIVGSVDQPIDIIQPSAAWRWTSSGGVQRLSGYGSFDTSSATGVSGDGSVIVGTVGILHPGVLISQAFRWTQGGGFQLLPGAPYRTWAYDVSSDGQVIVGQGEFGSGDGAFRWTAANGFQQLTSTVVDFHADAASAASADGSVIVGQGQSPFGYEAFIWDATHGTRPLTAVVNQMGIDLGGSYLESATAISADGSVITGRTSLSGGGLGYVLVLPEPSAMTMLLCSIVAIVAASLRRRSPHHVRPSDSGSMACLSNPM